MDHDTTNAITPTGDRWFLVRLGFTAVQVQSSDAAAAIDVARRVLSVELPRLYDVIHRLAADRFHVTEIEASGGNEPQQGARDRHDNPWIAPGGHTIWH